MKKFKPLLFAVVGLLIFTACGLWTEAPEPYIPQGIIGVTKSNMEYSEMIVDETQIDEVLSIITNAKPTKRQSNNDTPYVETFYTVRLICEEDGAVFYLYEDTSFFGLFSAWYLEQPYHGVYEISQEDAQILLNMQ